MQNYLIYSIFFLMFIGLFRQFLTVKKTNSFLLSQNKSLDSRLKFGLEETLELATSEQLIKELRVRKNMPFVLLLPIKEKDYNGITIESHCINPISCFAMLHLAKAITAQNFKKNGTEPPKLPPLNDYFD